MKHFSKALFVAAIACLALPAFSQSTPSEKASKSDVILAKLRQVDLLNHILPLLLTKEQIGKLLPEIEKARAYVVKTEDAEYQVLSGHEAEISDIIDKGIQKGEVPGKDSIRKINKEVIAMYETRRLVADENVDLVFKVVDSTLNNGQKKAMANALDPKSYDPTVKVESLKDEDKMRFFIRDVLLDPLSYDLLVKLSRSSATPDK